MKTLFNNLFPVSSHPELRKWRNKVLNNLLFTMYAFGCLVYLLGINSIYQHSIVENNPKTGITIFIFFTLCLIILTYITFNKKLSYRIRGTLLLALFFFIGIVGLGNIGLSGSGFIFLFGVISLAVILFDFKSSITVLVITIFSVAVIAILITTDVLNIPISRQANSQNLRSWISRTFVLLLFAITIIYTVSTIIKNFDNMLQQVQRENKFISAIFNTPSTLLAVVDRDGKIERFNQGCTKLTGYSFNEVKDKKIWDFFLYSMDRDEIKRLVKEIETTNEMTEFECCVDTKYMKKNVAWSITPLFDSTGSFKHIIFSGIDITERTNANKKLKESELHSKALLSILSKLEKSQTYSDLLTAPLEELKKIIGYKSVWIYLITDDRKHIKLLTSKGLKSEEITESVQILSAEEDPFICEVINATGVHIVEDAETDPRTNKKFVNLFKNKTIVHIPLYLGEKRLGVLGTGSFGDEGVMVPLESQKVFLTSMSNHIAEALQRIEINNEKLLVISELQESKKRLKTILNSVQAGIVLIDTETNTIVECNPTASKLIEENPENIIGSPCKNYFCLEEESSCPIQHGDINFHNTERQLYKKNGEIIPILETTVPIEIGGRKYILNSFFDITNLKETERTLLAAKKEAEKANRLKTIFLAQMSHEIRTPISSMVSLSSLVKDDLEDKVDDDLKVCFELINKAGDRIVRTVDLLLNLSEIQAGTYEVIKIQINLYSDILSKLLIEYKKLAEEKNIILKIYLDTKDVEFIADFYTVNQIFTQLLDNALKYTESGKVTISVLRNEDNKLTVKISDTGIGISDKYLSDLFEPFSQEDMGYTRQTEGNGIGLSLVKNYCDLNNAEILVESKKGVGSNFTVIFS